MFFNFIFHVRKTNHALIPQIIYKTVNNLIKISVSTRKSAEELRIRLSTLRKRLKVGNGVSSLGNF